MSTVFGAEKRRHALYDEDDDPILDELQLLDYRYMRFCYHPYKGRFVSVDSWKDPQWSNVKTIRDGIDTDDKDHREIVFGKNLINIEEKTVPQLLMDEVSFCGP
jgi:cation-transporting ATPase 13A3/4/5